MGTGPPPRHTLRRVAGTATSVIELLVGVGCLLAAAVTIRPTRTRWLGALLATAGVFAVVHAIAALAS